jgi:hypothetical protein
MSRVTIIALAALIAAAPLSTAFAQARGPVDLRGDLMGGFGLSGGSLVQDRGRGGRDRGDSERPRLMSEAQAQSIAQSRAGGARFVGSLGLRGTTYVFRFERDGRIIDIAVDARG